MIFYLGTTRPPWLWDGSMVVPLCLSISSFKGRKNLHRSKVRWILDSGAFQQLSTKGRFDLSARQHAIEVKRIIEQVGMVDFCSIQDWMCEANILNRTGLTIRRHQELSCYSYLDLMSIDPALPWLPILQGDSIEDYFYHIDLYRMHGVDLAGADRVGVGSVCRRSSSVDILRALHRSGFRLHGFGVKSESARFCVSADSQAWSVGRFRDQRRGLKSDERDFALDWLFRVLFRVESQVNGAAPSSKKRKEENRNERKRKGRVAKVVRCNGQISRLD